MGQTAEQRREETRDDLLMDMRGDYGNNIGLPGIRFVAPEVCKSASGRKNTYAVDEGKPPGIYLLSSKSRGGTRHLAPDHEERLLTRQEALRYAAAIDELAQPKPQSLGRGEEDGYYPATYVGLVVAWYDALARRLDRAIDASRAREAQFREVRASLTGEVSS